MQTRKYTTGYVDNCEADSHEAWHRAFNPDTTGSTPVSAFVK